MTQNGITVLNYLKKNFGKEVSKQQIAEDLGLSAQAVSGALTGFGGILRMTPPLASDRAEVVEIEPAVPATENSRGRKAKTKTIHYIMLNEDGLAYDAEKIEAEKAAAKEAAKAAKAAAKA